MIPKLTPKVSVTYHMSLSHVACHTSVNTFHFIVALGYSSALIDGANMLF